MPSAVTAVYRKPFFRPGFAVAGMTLLKQNETGKEILNSGQVEASRAARPRPHPVCDRRTTGILSARLAMQGRFYAI